MKSIIGKLCDFHNGALIIPPTITNSLSILLKRTKPLKEDIQRLSTSLQSLALIQPPQTKLDKDQAKSKVIDTNQPHVLQYGSRETAAYLSLRFLPSFAAINAILEQLQQRLPDFEPKTLLDYGCGPGTAIWYCHL